MQINNLFNCLLYKSKCLIKKLKPHILLLFVVKFLDLDKNCFIYKDFNKYQSYILSQFVVILLFY